MKSLAVVAAVCLTATACGSARDAAPIALPENAQPSAIYDANGTLITVLAEENRRTVALEQIPRSLQDAVVAIEDSRFWTHNGVDPRAVARAAGRNAEAGTVAEGGSTITQQYVKNAFASPEQTLGRKVEEATTALALERNYSKQLILELYLNTIYLGNGAYGVAAAAQEYFGVPVEQLTLDQSAMIAGVIQAPSRARSPQRPRCRRAAPEPGARTHARAAADHRTTGGACDRSTAHARSRDARRCAAALRRPPLRRRGQGLAAQHLRRARRDHR